MKRSTIDYMAEDLGAKLGCIVHVRRLMRREYRSAWSKAIGPLKMFHTGQVHIQFRRDKHDLMFETGRMSLHSAKSFIAALIDLNSFGFITWTKDKQLKPPSNLPLVPHTVDAMSPQKQSITC